MTELSPDMLHRLLRPSAVTIAGASPNGHITEHLLHNLRNRSCRFAGPIHLVNPGYRRLFELECFAGADSIQGSPGLVYLLVPPRASMGTLAALRERPDGVVLFADASRTAGGYEHDVAEWGWQNGVAVLGPQSNGLVSTGGALNGLLIPIIDDLQPGGVAVLAQSGGVLGGLVKFLAQRGVGIHSALEYGTACMLSPTALGERLLSDREVRLLALYADGLDSVQDFGRLLAAAREAGKPSVVMVAGASAAARLAIASHSGMAATPRRIIEGVAAQHGAILANDLDELAWSIEAIAAAGFMAPTGRAVAVFSDSGGGAIAMTEALDGQGIVLQPPSAEARSAIGDRFGDALNPFDFGSASMGQVREQAADVSAVSQDDAYGVFAFASTIGLALRERSVHIKQLDEFAATVHRLGRVPFIASSFPFAHEAGPGLPGQAIVGNGSKESAVKLRALSGSVRGSRTRPEPADRTHAGLVVTGSAAADALGHLPLRWPSQVTVASIEELEGISFSFPVVVKSEAGLAHRARQGGVLPGVSRAGDLRNAVTYLLQRFGGPVSISDQIEHEIEYFLGALRDEAGMLILLGAGGDQAESAAVRLAPMDSEQARRLATEQAPGHTVEFTDLVIAFQRWLLETEGIASVDLNPIVPVEGGLMALDAKLHRL